MNDTKQRNGSCVIAGEVDGEALRKELRQFTGTTQYHRNFLGMNYTDGVQYLAERAGAFWLIDAIASWQPYVRPVDHGFQVWELVVHGNRTAELTARRDAGQEPMAIQKIPYTDFPMKSVELWVEEGILILPSEH
ncbi:MAG TPA: hypothetical protein VN541_16685 [Tepidisphaeraceae bacterium]|nr:hypothetical protein [Tepidisphaeraceae bacterium]